MGPLAGPVAVWRTVQDAYSSFLAFGLLLLRNVDIVFVTASAAAAPCLFYYYQAAGKMLQYNVSWTLVSFAVVFPLTMGVSEAFRRRETAVQQLSAFRSNLISFFTAHVDWDWNITPSSVGGSASGRTHLSPEHTQAVRESCKELLDALVEMLNADRVMSPRHYFTVAGVEERSKVLAKTKDALQKGRAQMRHMSTLDEDFKRAGLVAGESSRLHAFLNQLQVAFEQLYCIKVFRTPSGLRVFTRVFIVLTPWMQGPYYAQLAVSTNIAFAIVTSVLTSFAMQGAGKPGLPRPSDRRT